MENLTKENNQNITQTQDNVSANQDMIESSATFELFENKSTGKRYKIDKLLSKRDIKYKGPFSYRTLRIIGFAFLLIAQGCACFAFLSKFKEYPEWSFTLVDVLLTIAKFSLPIFLAANFCVIMSDKKKIKKNLIFYSLMALLFYLAVVIVYYRYLLGIATALLEDTQSATATANFIAKKIFRNIINYNIFVDLALFSMFYFFLFFTPKNINTKKKLITFRAMSILPILFVIVAIVLYICDMFGVFEIPVAILALLPCRAPTFYVIFILISVFAKLREKRFLDLGGTKEEYNKYLKTKRNSFEISVISSIIIFAVCLVDFLLLVWFPEVILAGFGYNFYLVFVAPLILLLSYNKQPKYKFVDMLLPVIFVICTIILYLETALIFVKI